MKKTVIPDGSVTLIQEYAFESCYSLTEISFGRGLKKIESFAFTYCTNLTAVTMHEGIDYDFYRVFDSHLLFIYNVIILPS